MPFAVYLLALAVFAMGTSEFMLAGLVPDIAADLDVPVGTAGLLTSAYAGGMVVGAPAMAVLTRRWPTRGTLVACVLLFAATHVVVALAPEYAIVLVMRVLAAFANAGFLAVGLSAAAALVPADRTGRAVAVLIAGTTLATVAGVPGGALLGTAFGWRSTFWAIAALCAPAAVGIATRYPARVAPTSRDRSAEPALRSELGVLGSPRLLGTMLVAALVNAGTFAALTFLAPIVTDTTGLAPWWVPVALALFGAGSFVGVTVAGRFSDRRPLLLLGAGSVLLVLGWLAFAAFATAPFTLLALVVIQGALGFAIGSTAVTQVLAAADGAPTMRGSYATAALNAGAVAGPVLGAASLGTGLGDLGPIWVAVATSSAALVLVVALLSASQPRKADAKM